MSRNPARKGPVKVWSGYRNLRVPIELFDDVKKYMEKRKLEYFGEKSTIDDFSIDEPLSITIDTLTKKVEDLEKKLSMLTEKSSEKIKKQRQPKMTSKERILQFLQTHPGERFSTVEIARELDIPDATCRQSARELAASHPNVYQISGKPNKFYYQ